MKATPITLSIKIADTAYAINSVRLHKSIGNLTVGECSIMPAGSLGIPITGDSVEQFAADFNALILEKSDVEPNVQLTMPNGLNFNGILTGARTHIAASGSAEFSITVAEPTYMLNSMLLNCYPANNAATPVSAVFKADARHPFVRISNPTGSIANRIRTLYDTAKAHTREIQPENPVDRVYEQQRGTNLQLESLFFDLLERSEMEPAWLTDLPTEINHSLNDFIVSTLFQSGLTLWQGLLMLANALNLVYVGDFTTGGYFKQLNFDSGGARLAVSGKQSLLYQLGTSSQQTVGQIMALTQSTNPSKSSPVSVVFNGSTTISKVAGVYPETPEPANGRIIAVQAPSFFTAKVEKVKEDPLLSTGTTAEDAKAVAANIKSGNERAISVFADTTPLINAWCRDMYLQYRSRNMQAQLDAPFTADEYVLADALQVGELQGILRSVTHALTISENSGRAATTYNVAYIQP